MAARTGVPESRWMRRTPDPRSNGQTAFLCTGANSAPVSLFTYLPSLEAGGRRSLLQTAEYLFGVFTVNTVFAFPQINGIREIRFYYVRVFHFPLRRVRGGVTLACRRAENIEITERVEDRADSVFCRIDHTRFLYRVAQL